MNIKKEDAMAKRMLNILEDLVPEKATSAEVLRAFRKREGFSLDDLEQITGIAATNLSAIENGKIEMTKHYAEIFAAALDVHPNVLLYPNGSFVKDKKLVEIELKARKFRKNG